jgi:hypothetical protein
VCLWMHIHLHSSLRYLIARSLRVEYRNERLTLAFCIVPVFCVGTIQTPPHRSDL